jgi:hypothetical protein
VPDALLNVGWIAPSAATWRAEDVSLSLELERGDATPRQRWLVSEQLRVHQLWGEVAHNLDIQEEHVLLLLRSGPTPTCSLPAQQRIPRWADEIIQ